MISVRFSFSANAFSSMISILSGIVNVVKLHVSNADTPIVVTPSGIFTLER